MLMPNYRTCVRGDDGTILRSFSFIATDDDQAIEKSGNLDGIRIEIWEGDRLVKRLEQTLAVRDFPRRRF
jgi:hypothetical protein